MSPLSLSDSYFTGYFNTIYTLKQAEGTHELNQQSAFSQYIISTLHWSYALPFLHRKLSRKLVFAALKFFGQKTKK